MRNKINNPKIILFAISMIFLLGPYCICQCFYAAGKSHSPDNHMVSTHPSFRSLSKYPHPNLPPLTLLQLYITPTSQGISSFLFLYKTLIIITFMLTVYILSHPSPWQQGSLSTLQMNRFTPLEGVLESVWTTSWDPTVHRFLKSTPVRELSFYV